MIGLVSASNSSDVSVPMMMMETRQQNTEVRVSLSKISDKVDRLADKVCQKHCSLVKNYAQSAVVVLLLLT